MEVQVNAQELRLTAARDHEACWSGASPNDSFTAASDVPQISVIVPTRNEVGNIRPLIARIASAQRGVPTEVLFVDDSDDETPTVVAALAEELAEKMVPVLTVRMLHRPTDARHGGLGGAVVEGIRVARAPWVCVMDADLQHPPELLRSLLNRALAEDASLVVASRYCATGNSAGLSSPSRVLISRGASASAKLLFPRRLRRITDPMSGFFLVDRNAVDADALKPRGFKILLEIAVRTGGLRVTEVGYSFGDRYSGESKSGTREGIRFVLHVGRLRGATIRRSPASRSRPGLSGSSRRRSN
jgi:glycosyltransferase involved in cell wall biosynthesis